MQILNKLAHNVRILIPISRGISTSALTVRTSLARRLVDACWGDLYKFETSAHVGMWALEGCLG